MKRTVLAILMVVAVAVAFSATAYAQAKAPGVVTLKASMGGVKFDHAGHSKKQGATCATCHHASKPEKPMKGAQQACGDCHTSKPEAPMKTKLQAAFHDPMAKKGICIDCHAKENAAGKKAPTTCTGCHKKENV
jgi:cytochrome c5